MFIFVTIYCGDSSDEFQTTYNGMINKYDPGSITVTLGINDFAFFSYDAKEGILLGRDLYKVVHYDNGITTYYYVE